MIGLCLSFAVCSALRRTSLVGGSYRCLAKVLIPNGIWFLCVGRVHSLNQATPIAGTMLYYQRGWFDPSLCAIPTSQLISQEPNQGIEYEYYLPHGRSREGYYWSFGSWSSCSRECGSGQTGSTTWSFAFLIPRL
uniref:Papilin a, proteoglycan-like sulfated glycoprotein n=1 Tax=Fundulus heteroclitus TaxID=8078 RepID=A0A3Q2QSP8_FUNHE